MNTFEKDLDTMRDVYMSSAQRDAYLRIRAAALRAQPAGGGEDWQARALAAEADIERMTDAFNRENGPTFMGEPVLPPENFVPDARPVFAALDSVVPGWREHGSDTARAAATAITELSARATSNGAKPFRWDDDEGEAPSA